jgi:nitrate reductase gamma subunit
MDLLGFARGPALKLALAVFCIGVVWRIVGFGLLRIRLNRSRPRASIPRFLAEGLLAVGTRSWPHPEFIGRTGAGEALGYSYHIGLFAVVLLFGPHIAFLGSLLGLTWLGLTWPGLPSSLITVISVLTVTLFLAVLFRRVTNPVIRMLSNFDDYFSWIITMLVLATGLAATAHLGGPYQTLLALHILSVDVLLLWFPFGKLMHAFYIFPSRAINGAILARKGATS